MLTLESKFSEYCDLCTHAGACIGDGSGGDFNAALLKENPDITMKDMMAKYPWSSVNERWIVWVIQSFGKDIDPKLREIPISNIKDPMNCMMIYLKCDFLSDAEDMLLKSHIDGKLPTAEKELATGVVTRAKVESVKP